MEIPLSLRQEANDSVYQGTCEDVSFYKALVQHVTQRAHNSNCNSVRTGAYHQTECPHELLGLEYVLDWASWEIDNREDHGRPKCRIIDRWRCTARREGVFRHCGVFLPSLSRRLYTALVVAFKAAPSVASNKSYQCLRGTRYSNSSRIGESTITRLVFLVNC